MHALFDYISGSVPGGIGLYALLVATIFLVLRSISRRNDLFTSRLFRIWFAAVWLLLTMVYVVVWVSNPPPTAFTRYATLISADAPEDRWLAIYLREAVNERLKAYRGATDYLYWQRWNLMAGTDCCASDIRRCEHIMSRLPVAALAVGRITGEGADREMELSLRRDGDETYRQTLRFPVEAPDQAVLAMMNWLNGKLPLSNQPRPMPLVDREFVLAKDAFYNGDYTASQRMCRNALGRFPDNREIQKWYHFNTVRIAAAEKQAARAPNPYATKRTAWEQKIDSARPFLLTLVQKNLESRIDDVFLNVMVAESYILDELYKDAEEILKLAFNANPFSVELLEKLSLLHPSRWEGLPFAREDQLLERILAICPIHERVMTRYVDDLLQTAQVSEAPSIKIRALLERMLDIAPASASGWNMLGKYQLTVFDYRQALKAFQKADSLDPGDPVVFYNLGIASFKMKDLPAAEGYFRRAAADGSYLDAYLYLGVIYQERGEFDKALAQYRYRVANKRSDNDYYANQAMKGIRECLEALNIPIPD